MRLLLLGAGGRLGTALTPRLEDAHELAAYPRSHLDITDRDALAAVLRHRRPEVILNAAAHTDVAGARSDRDAAFAVNAEAVGRLGEIAREAGALVVHISTDFVFDGRSERPYRETDDPHPLNAYGASKLAGERALIESGAACAILRTAWLYDAASANFVTAMIDAAAQGKTMRVVTGETGSPTAAPALADAIAAMLAHGSAAMARAASSDPVFHAACRGQASRFALARAAVADAGLDPALIEPVTDRPGDGVARPAFSVLDSARFERAFGLAMPDWRAALAPVARARLPLAGARLPLARARWPVGRTRRP